MTDQERAALTWFLGEAWRDLNGPDLVAALQAKGVAVHGQMTLAQVIAQVVADYEIQRPHEG